jgi:hypothetical protein
MYYLLIIGRLSEIIPKYECHETGAQEQAALGLTKGTLAAPVPLYGWYCDDACDIS